jgi:hypothetical protein
MSEPVVETIIEDLLEAFDGITVQAGYNYTVKHVARFDRYTGEESERPAVLVRYLGETLGRASVTERSVSAAIEILGKLEYNPHSGTETDRQAAIFGFDIASAITHIDYATKSYDVSDLSITPLIEESPDEPIDGVRLLLTFNYLVDAEDIHTVTESRS